MRAPGAAASETGSEARALTSAVETAARACRALAYQEERAAKRMENPTVRAPIEGTAKRAAALAEKFERARNRRSA
jgi:hypothetical protein